MANQINLLFTVTYTASQCAYLYYALKVCTLLRKSTHFWKCCRRVGKLWDILSRNCVFNRGLCRTKPVTVYWPVNHLVTVNIVHISFNWTSYHSREKRTSSVICQSRVFHVENSALIFCIMMHLKVNNQMDVYKSSHCCCRLNITRITINTYVF